MTSTGREIQMRWRLLDQHAAVFSLEGNGVSCEVGTTYGMDSFSDLIRTAADVRLGVEATYALLAGEPAGAILFVSRLGAQVDLRLVSFSAMSVAMTRFIDGNLRWHGSVSSGDFVDAIVDMAQMVEQEYGRSEFERRWGHAFPAQRLAKFR